MTLCHLLQSRCFAEAPTIHQLAEGRCGVHKRELRHPETLLSLPSKLIPHAGVATIFNKAAYVGRRNITRETHRGGSSHRHAMHDHLRSMPLRTEHTLSHRGPMKDVLSVFPSHLHIIAFTQSVGMKVWQDDVIAHRPLVY